VSADSFGDVWRAVKLHCPSAGVFLVQDWCSGAWKELAGKRDWSFLRGQLQIQIRAVRGVTCTVTIGSNVVTSAGAFLSTDESRQFVTGFTGSPSGGSTYNFPTYTILQFNSANQITLDQPYGVDLLGNAPGTVRTGVSASIGDYYYVAPADFGHFTLIADPYYQRRLAFWIDQDQLNILDPTRQASDTGPRLLASHSPSTYAGGNQTSTLGQIRYEFWPRPTANRTYPALYQKQPLDLSDSNVFSGVLYNRATNVLKKGALVRAAEWPGGPGSPNPYFNMALADRLRKEWEGAIQEVALADDNHYSNDLTHVHWERWPLADLAYNDKSLRATDSTIADLY
jgi:hypothetical protein